MAGAVERSTWASACTALQRSLDQVLADRSQVHNLDTILSSESLALECDLVDQQAGYDRLTNALAVVGDQEQGSTQLANPLAPSLELSYYYLGADDGGTKQTPLSSATWQGGP